MPRSRTIRFHHPKKADVAKIVEIFSLNDHQAASVSELLRDLVDALHTQESTRESLNASAPKSQSLARLHRIQSALSEAAQGLREADRRTALLLNFACDYRASTRTRNAVIKVLLKDMLLLDSWRQQTLSDVPYEGPLELLNELPEHKREWLAERGQEMMLTLVESLRQPIERILEVERHTRCGAPGKPHRNFAICCLAHRFEPIFGRAPTATPSGPFVLFCELCLEAIGLDTVGAEKAVQSVLRSQKKFACEAEGRRKRRKSSSRAARSPQSHPI
jgi:hypothetical protein